MEALESYLNRRLPKCL